ncbi:MAG TPA: DUF2071 domain-containing protein [Actinomycetota bacterium]|nr:DUF2071 domain-containing protein [Actinomycetota bacterium]
MGAPERRLALAQEAKRRVADVRDDPHGRLALAEDAYLCGSDTRLRHFSRAELAFIQWEIRRGVLAPVEPNSPHTGSPWWRTVNETLLRDCEEGSLLYRDGIRDGGSNHAVGLWLKFFDAPSPDAWYRAHNASIVSGYLAASSHAVVESEAEQILMNVILTRALYAYLLAARQARLGFLARVGQWLANPAGEGIVVVIDLPDFYPSHYPMSAEDERRLLGAGFEPESLLERIGNLVTFYDIERVFSWNSQRIGIPELMTLVSKGSPCYPAGSPVVTEAATREAARARELTERFDLVAADAAGLVADRTPWIAAVSLQHVCFTTWEVDESDIVGVLPAGVEPDHYNGKCYITAVSMRSVNMHFRGLPPLPGGADYPELNFRTYVKCNGEPGVVFLSVDGTPGGSFAWLAKHMFRMPYHEADMDMNVTDAQTSFVSARRDATGARYEVTYQVANDTTKTDPGSFEEFISVRLVGFSSLLGRIWRYDIRHKQWPLQAATASHVEAGSLFTAAGLPPPTGSPLLMYSAGTDDVMWAPVPT